MKASDWTNRILEVEEEQGVGSALFSGEAQSLNKKYKCFKVLDQKYLKLHCFDFQNFFLISGPAQFCPQL